MKRVGLIAAIITAILLLTACDGSMYALVHLDSEVYFIADQKEGVLDKYDKDALNSLLSGVNASILSDRAQQLYGEEIVRFQNDKRDVVVSINRSGEEYYIYTADILDGTELSKEYYTISNDIAEEIIDTLNTY